MTVIAQAAMGTRRLEGPICEKHHVWMPATPGRQDQGWMSVGGRCFHLDSNSVAFDTFEDAEIAVNRDALR